MYLFIYGHGESCFQSTRCPLFYYFHHLSLGIDYPPEKSIGFKSDEYSIHSTIAVIKWFFLFTGNSWFMWKSFEIFYGSFYHRSMFWLNYLHFIAIQGWNQIQNLFFEVNHNNDKILQVSAMAQNASDARLLLIIYFRLYRKQSFNLHVTSCIFLQIFKFLWISNTNILGLL